MTVGLWFYTQSIHRSCFNSCYAQRSTSSVQTASAEVDKSTSNGPTLKIIYVAPGFEIILPQQVAEAPEIFANSFSTLHKISSSTVVKRSIKITPVEARTMLFVKEKTSIPIPKLYAAYEYKCAQGDPTNAQRLAGTYLFMEYIQGDTLENVWGTYGDASKSKIEVELRIYMDQLRSLPAPGYIGSVDQGQILIADSSNSLIMGKSLSSLR